MSVELESAKRLSALKSKADTVTGETSDTLADAVDTLIAGFGQGGGGSDETKAIIEGTLAEFKNDEVTKIKNYIFYKNTAITSAESGSVKNIDEYAFQQCTNLKKISFPNIESIGNYAFLGCSALTEVADMTLIHHTWYQCFDGAGLTEFPYMPNLKYIMNSFSNCLGLTKVCVHSTVMKEILNKSFNGCTNLTDIYVPWAEGAIGNAPWGATNATIHYNTVYDENHEPIV